MIEQTWLSSTHQTWKAESALISRILGAALTASGVGLLATTFASFGGLLSILGIVLGLLGPVLFRFSIVCPVCSFRPYFHRPLVRGAELAQLIGCPRCGGHPSTDLLPLKTQWSIGSLVIVLLAIWLLMFVLPDAVLRRGLRAP